MKQPWHDAVAVLEGTDGAMRLMDGAGWDANFVAEVIVPGGLFRSRGGDEEEAWRGVAHGVARDRDGSLWAIGVAAADGDRRGHIETDIGFDGRVFDRAVFIDPLDTLDSGALLAELEAST